MRQNLIFVSLFLFLTLLKANPSALDSTSLEYASTSELGTPARLALFEDHVVAYKSEFYSFAEYEVQIGDKKPAKVFGLYKLHDRDGIYFEAELLVPVSGIVPYSIVKGTDLYPGVIAVGQDEHIYRFYPSKKCTSSSASCFWKIQKAEGGKAIAGTLNSDGIMVYGVSPSHKLIDLWGKNFKVGHKDVVCEAAPPQIVSKWGHFARGAYCISLDKRIYKYTWNLDYEEIYEIPWVKAESLYTVGNSVFGISPKDWRVIGLWDNNGTINASYLSQSESFAATLGGADSGNGMGVLYQSQEKLMTSYWDGEWKQKAIAAIHVDKIGVLEGAVYVLSISENQEIPVSQISKVEFVGGEDRYEIIKL